MKRTCYRATLLILAVLSFIFVSTTGYRQVIKGQLLAADAASDIPTVTRLIQTAVNSNHLHGASLLLKKDNRVIYEKAFGDYTLDTAVPIASASKLLSASTIMTLVDEGRLSLDTPISKHLPNFSGKAKTITLRQLMSHTSGLPGLHPCLADRSITLAECVNQISQVELLSDPGTQFSYGDVSFQVAGRMAEVASGKSWKTLFEQKIKKPVNMIHTTYGDTENPRLAGGAVSTLQDYANLLQMHLNHGIFDGQQVLSVASVEQMQRDQTAGAKIAFTPLPDSRRYGLGEWRDIVNSQGRAIQLSCQGVFGFSPWIDVERNLLGIFLVQDRLRHVYRTVEQVQNVIRELLDSKRLTKAIITTKT
ncbi:MAG TPA: serine hydrolase domain-containing protein [Allocoleopsis sp.]